MKKIHLICNAHLDPFWQWDWEEGAASAVSTFRAAADLCEEFDNFIFCHNEALLYRWVEEYEPALFKRIQKLVKEGKWHIMGGWYIQPDCNMPSGEAIIRQIKLGREYFYEKFGVVNNTAISFDAFGHNKGLVQILKKAGYDSYLFMRPFEEEMHLPKESFQWKGYDGSTVTAHRLTTSYNSRLGQGKDELNWWLEANPNIEMGLFTWGVGNHGGGPSRKDISDINEYISNSSSEIVHSYPEQFFSDLKSENTVLPEIDFTLAPTQVGCYTSQIRIKQEYRKLENIISTTEKMITHAVLSGLMDYPTEKIQSAVRDLCLAQFHDILPGSSIQSVEESALQLLHHGAEIMTKLRAKAFFALSSGQKKADTGTYPILVYNPHPYEVEEDIACEFMLADQNWKEEFTVFKVACDGEYVPAQIEKERSNVPLDWRKRVVFHAKLKPMQINRFDCIPETLPERPIPKEFGDDGNYYFDNGSFSARISKKTGCLAEYCVDGINYLENEVKLIAVQDSEDAWGMNVRSFRNVIGSFDLMNETQSAEFAGVKCKKLAPVRVVEDGPVRTVIEASFTYNNSSALVQYILPKFGKALSVKIRLYNAERSTMIKLSVPTVLKKEIIGQGMFGFGGLKDNGDENVAQKWVASSDESNMLAIINDGVYGNDFSDGEIRISLARSAAYTGHTLLDRTILPQHRFTERMEQGERIYNFELLGGEKSDVTEKVTLEAQQFNEKSFALSFFPDGNGVMPQYGIKLDGKGIQLVAFRMNKDKTAYIVQLFESTGKGGKAEFEIPALNTRCTAVLEPFEVKAFRINIGDNVFKETDILE